MKTRCGSARMGLALLLTITTGCAGVRPHLELPTLDIRQPAFAVNTARAPVATSNPGSRRSEHTAGR